MKHAIDYSTFQGKSLSLLNQITGCELQRVKLCLKVIMGPHPILPRMNRGIKPCGYVVSQVLFF